MLIYSIMGPEIFFENNVSTINTEKREDLTVEFSTKLSCSNTSLEQFVKKMIVNENKM